MLRAVRKLVLGETWSLPVGIAVAVGAAFLVRATAGADGWWQDAGGFLLLGLLVVAFLAALRSRR